MAIFRCNKCGYLREVANEHIGKSAKCSQCQNVAGIHETTAFIEKIIEKYFTLQKELVNLREGTSSWDQLEIQVIDSPQSEPFSLKEIDPHNTKELTNNYQYLPIIEWFDKKNIKAKVNPRELDTTGFFDEIALALGNNYEKFKEISDKIKWMQKKGYTSTNFQLADKSQKEIQEFVKFCSDLYKYSFISKYFYQKQEKIIKITLQQSPQIVNFFNGIWLEWFAFMKIINFFKEENIKFSGARCLTIDFSNDDHFELDNFFLIQNKIPVCIECKSKEFRQELEKYAKIRKRIGLEKNNFLLCVADLSDDQAQGLTSMYEITFVNEKNLLQHVKELISS